MTTNQAPQGTEPSKLEIAAMKVAIEGECDGLAITDDQAVNMITYLKQVILSAQPASAPLQDAKDAIPEGVYYSLENDNFYDVSDRCGMGIAFYREWLNKSTLFPQSFDAAIAAQGAKQI